MLISLLLNAIIAPFAQDKARSFIRSSNLDFFESILKPKKFIDVIGNLTIYFDKKNKNNELINIFLNEKKNINSSQTTYAKTAIINIKDDKKILTLYDGKSINIINGKISEFKFSKTDYNISKFSSKSVTYQKNQETPTIDLIRCALFSKDPILKSEYAEKKKIKKCRLDKLEDIYKELYSRLVKPLYITFLTAISLLIILKSKSDHSFNVDKFKIYLFAFLFIIFLESSSKFITINFLQNLFLTILPLILTLIIYLYFLMRLKVNRT